MSDSNFFKIESGTKAKAVVMIVGMVLLATVVSFAILRDRITNTQYRQVTVTGQGRVAYQPDLAVINLGVQIDKAEKAEDALNQLNARVNKIMTAVIAEGVLAEDISTQNYNLYAQYDYKDNISVVSGYNANQQLSIKVKEYDANPERLNKVIAAASKAGANQINSLSFDASNINDLKQRARILALQDAKDKSTSLAAAAGVTIKNIAGWWENVVQSPYVGGYGGAEKGMVGDYSAQTPSGSREVVIEVGVNYNIK